MPCSHEPGAIWNEPGWVSVWTARDARMPGAFRKLPAPPPDWISCSENELFSVRF